MRHWLVVIGVMLAVTAHAAECRRAESVCIDASATKSISGVTFTLAQAGGCWRWRDTYQCVGSQGASTGNCASLDARNCSCVSDACTKYYAPPFDSICDRRTFTYSCPSGSAQQITTNDCVSRVGCTTNADGTQNCIDSGYPADADFGKAMVAMEVGREAGIYRNGDAFFSGVLKTCRSKNSGFSTSCCDSSGAGAQPNSSIMTAAVFGNALKVGGDVLSYGYHSASSVVYDAAYMSEMPSWLPTGVQAWVTDNQRNVAAAAADGFQAVAPGFSTQISMGGLLMSYQQTPTGILDSLSNGLKTLTGATEGISVPTMLQPSEIAKNLFDIQGLNLSFDPVSFGFQMAYMVYQSLVACTPDEMKLGMLRGSNLCVSGGEDCDDGGPFGLLTSCTQFYCCYNSKLARIINTQALPQFGRRPGRDCGGLSDGELTNLDWDTIDLSEFVNDMIAQTKLPDAAAIQGRAPAVVQKVKNYYAP